MGVSCISLSIVNYVFKCWNLGQEIPPHNYICGLVAEHNTIAFNSR